MRWILACLAHDGVVHAVGNPDGEAYRTEFSAKAGQALVEGAYEDVAVLPIERLEIER